MARILTLEPGMSDCSAVPGQEKRARRLQKFFPALDHARGIIGPEMQDREGQYAEQGIAHQGDFIINHNTQRSAGILPQGRYAGNFSLMRVALAYAP